VDRSYRIQMVVKSGRQPTCIEGRPNSRRSDQRERPSLPVALGISLLVLRCSNEQNALHIDLPASSNAIMRRAHPYRGENLEPGKDAHRELDPGPGIREQPRPLSLNRGGTCSPTQQDLISINHPFGIFKRQRRRLLPWHLSIEIKPRGMRSLCLLIRGPTATCTNAPSERT
jgi:hypothetical protein